MWLHRAITSSSTCTLNLDRWPFNLELPHPRAQQGLYCLQPSPCQTHPRRTRLLWWHSTPPESIIWQLEAGQRSVPCFCFLTSSKVFQGQRGLILKFRESNVRPMPRIEENASLIRYWWPWRRLVGKAFVRSRLQTQWPFDFNSQSRRCSWSG